LIAGGGWPKGAAMRFALCFLIILTGLAPGSLLGRAVPDLGLILNDDGDYSFIDSDPQYSVACLRAGIDALSGTPVRTLMYSVGAGSDVLYYPTHVASIWGWRKTRYDQPKPRPAGEDDGWPVRIQKIVTGMRAGIDPIRVAGEEAKSLGMRFFPSYRMNDDHFMFDPYQYPLTGEFWMEHHDQLIIRDSPILSQNAYGNLFDYSYRDVRGYRLSIIHEIIDRYEDIMSGIELDFNRVQVFFPRGTASDRAHLLTDVVRQVRTWLDSAANKNGHQYYLVVRVPPTLQNCHWAGLEVEKWMREGLVDVISPSQLMTLAHDMPIDDFVSQGAPNGCKVYPSLYPMTSYSWPFGRSLEATDFSLPPSQEVSPEIVRGAAANYWAMGADGFELFNFHHEDTGARPYSDRVYRIMRDLAGPKTLELADKVFAITPGYYLDYEDTYEYAKQLPVTLKPGFRQQLKLFVGEDLSRTEVMAMRPYVALRLGFLARPALDQLEVIFNGHKLVAGSSVTTNAKRSHDKYSEAAPGSFVQIPITGLSMVKKGVNQIYVTLGAQQRASQIKLLEVRLGVIYDCKYLDLIFK
jgi:hypothetical protein